MIKKLSGSGLLTLVLIAALILLASGACAPEEPVARSYSCAVYTEQGCAKFVVASGGEIEIQSGGTLDVQSGSTVDYGGVIRLANGTSSAPALAFTSDTDSGIYRVGANNVGVAISATLISDWSSSNLDMNNLPIVNIGAAGTDFGTDGSLTTALTVTITSGGLTVSAGGANITGSIDGSADIDISTWLNLSAQSTIALADGGTITPTGTYQVITSTAAVTTSTSTAIANGSEIGNLLIIRNGNASDNIIVDGTGANVECKANVTLGASDTLTLIWNGSDWNCLAGYDNS